MIRYTIKLTFEDAHDPQAPTVAYRAYIAATGPTDAMELAPRVIYPHGRGVHLTLASTIIERKKPVAPLHIQQCAMCRRGVAHLVNMRFS